MESPAFTSGEGGCQGIASITCAIGTTSGTNYEISHFRFLKRMKITHGAKA